MKPILAILLSSAFSMLTVGCGRGFHSVTVAPVAVSQVASSPAPTKVATPAPVPKFPEDNQPVAVAQPEPAKPLTLSQPQPFTINSLPAGKIETVVVTGERAVQPKPVVPENSAVNLTNLPDKPISLTAPAPQSVPVNKPAPKPTVIADNHVETVVVTATRPKPQAPSAPAPANQPENLLAKKVNSHGTLRRLYDVLAESKVSQKALMAALDYMSKTRQKFANRHFMTLIDYSKPSTEKRMYVMNLDDGTYTTHLVAHGRGSGELYATNFGNEEGSYMTSLGVYRTLETYDGSHGRSLRLEGLSTSNSEALSREIVVHGAGAVDVDGQQMPYVSAVFVKFMGYLGRSEGCPALDPNEAQAVIGKIENGSMMYAFKYN